MKYLKDWKVHAFCFGMVLVSELIGSKPFKFGPVGFTLLPMLYALIIGIILAIGIYILFSPIGIAA